MKEPTTLTVQRRSLNRLRRDWWLLVLGWATAIVAGALLLSTYWKYGWRWLLLVAPIAVYQLILLRQTLSQNHRPGERKILSSLGPGNHLTLLRGLALAMLGGFLFSPRPPGILAWAPALLYTGASIADYLDGYLARRANHMTVLGERLDIAFDSLGVLLVCLLAVWDGQLPLWYLPLGLGRYLFLAGIWCRHQLGKQVFSLQPSNHRRIFAGFHMGFLTVVLWPIIPPAGATIAGAVFGGATAISFLRDWAVVSGRLDPAAPRYRRWRRRIFHLLTRTAPPLLRVWLLATMLWLLLTLPTHLPPSWLSTLRAWQMPLAIPLAYGLMLAALAGTVSSFLGIVPRLAALILLFPLGFDIITFSVRWPTAFALVSALLLLLFGGGRATLWEPEARYIYHRSGET